MSETVILGESGHVERVIGTRRIVQVMGTVFTIDARDIDPLAPAVRDVVAWWRWVDQTFSTFRPDSEVSRLAAGTLRLADAAPEVRHVLDLCDQAASASRGYFTSRPGGRLDLSGMVKGWSVDVASDMLRHADSADHCIVAGGDVLCLGAPSADEHWRIGVVDPFDPRRLLAAVSPASVSRWAIATSGTAERGDHIVDPVGNRRPGELASVTVIASTLTVADWMATAAFATGHESQGWLEQHEGVEAYAVTATGDYWCTDGFEAMGELLALPGDA